MARHLSTFGLSPEKMSELMRIGSDDHDYKEGITPEQTKSELLADRLSEPLLVDSSLSKLLPSIPGLLSSVIDIDASEPIGDLLQNPDVDISLLNKVKHYFNRQSKDSQSKVECAISLALYYGVIASALVFHNNKITKFSHEDLEKAFSSLIDKTWIPESIISLYTKACTICQNANKSQNS